MSTELSEPLQEIRPDPASRRGGQDMPRAVDSAYREIRQAILTGKLKSGDSLVEVELAGRIGVSRTPIREALNRLRDEGLVVLERYRKTYVAKFSEEDVRQTFRLRAVLEGQAAGLAAAAITADDLARLQDLAAEMEEAVEVEGPDAIVPFDALNRRFHDIIIAAAGVGQLERLLHSSLELPAAILSGHHEALERRLRRTNWQHREVIAALKAGNPEWAEAQMRAHLVSLVSKQS